MFPPGASVTSVMGASMFLGRKVSATGRVLDRLWGMSADEVARECLGSETFAGQILARHTFAPMRLALVSSDAAEKLKSSLLRGAARGVKNPAISAVVRRCRYCVTGDVSKVGAAFPRLLHQLRPVRHCPEHHCQLEEKCASCGSDFGGLHSPLSSIPGRFLAGDISECRTCGADSGVPLTENPSRVYALYVDLLASVWSGAHWALEPSARQYLIKTAIQIFGDRLGSLAHVFTREWGAGSLCAAASLCGTTAPRIADQLRRAKDTSDNPLASFAVTAFALLYLRDHGREDLIERARNP